MWIIGIFSDHPSSVGETWSEHALRAFKISYSMAAASIAALFHAIFPFLFKTTASQTIKRINKEIEDLEAKSTNES
ncbi:MAG: DUF6356 family protein [Acidimicrobiales bacterium]|nr:capsule biosynthesis protein [Acidimicrobiaceae bacterium]MDP6161300.1 DUF6356 family protein [Acidimicrobiales bacterium]MDP6286164.1 DUF6356 family protein [Acidimicrobiales bacterium]HJL91969.1 DUF6356 family protein [Acidimicrobiales bacterium]HJO40256.1 DUF6356 family protein [Acidimicrobiales bacterium]